MAQLPRPICLFRIEDRRGVKYLLSPTHEEEITSLVGGVLQSYRDLPLRLYQISRKYRDEPRPRQGLLRTREFLMKDLYTFDASEKEALETYKTVREAYTAFFNELKIPYLVAEAHSGDIGGETSHEYHFPSAKGEDSILSCSECDYFINEELAKDEYDVRVRQAQSLYNKAPTEGIALARAVLDHYHDQSGEAFLSEDEISLGCRIWYGVTADRTTLVEAIFPQLVRVTNLSGTFSHWRETEACTNSIRSLIPDIDLSIENPVEAFKRSSHDNKTTEAANRNLGNPRSVYQIIDYRVTKQALNRYDSTAQALDGSERYTLGAKETVQTRAIEANTSLVKIAAGDPCPKCFLGAVQKTKAIELGHTFHLGTRYSKALDACFIPAPQPSEPATTVTTDAQNRTSNPALRGMKKMHPPKTATGSLPATKIPVQMGCHGIGISRMIAAVADTLADVKGLNWPRVMAPFEVLIVPKDEYKDRIYDVYNSLLVPTPESTHNASPLREDLFDVIVDDRKQSFVWKLNDADLIGYPIIIVLGKRYGKEQICEVQCRRLGVKEDVHIGILKARASELLRQL
ncbi:MAG: hypothetical protein Q9195_003874 [Heterodermia aff. obscurata]